MPKFGYKHSEEAIEKLRLSHTGHRHSEETRAKMSSSKKGVPQPWHKGRVFTEEHRRKISLSRKDKKPNNYKGWTMHGKYKRVFHPDHPDATKEGYVLEHRLVMEEKAGRRLLAGEVVHHIDGNGLNNDPLNLLLLTPSEHMSLHHGLGTYRKS